MEILLDTNFILSCVKQKLDFVNYASENIECNVNFIIPREVIFEIKTISERKGEKLLDRQAAKVSLDLIRVSNFKEIILRSRNVDRGIIGYLNKNPKVAVATMDNGILKRIKNSVLTIKQKKRLEILG